MTAMGEIMIEQMLLLEEISAKPNPWITGEQTEELLREVKEEPIRHRINPVKYGNYFREGRDSYV